MSACEKGGAWVEALELYERMKSYSNNDDNKKKKNSTTTATATIRPNIVTIASLILALDTAGQKELSLDIYRQALRRRILKNPWRFSTNTSGERILVMDLHHYSQALARVTIRNYMESLLEQQHQQQRIATNIGIDDNDNDDLVIVVGRGLRSLDSPVLMNATTHLFLSEYDIHPQVDPDNTGRLIVSVEALERFVRRNSWR